MCAAHAVTRESQPSQPSASAQRAQKSLLRHCSVLQNSAKLSRKSGEAVQPQVTTADSRLRADPLACMNHCTQRRPKLHSCLIGPSLFFCTPRSKLLLTNDCLCVQCSFWIPLAVHGTLHGAFVSLRAVRGGPHMHCGLRAKRWREGALCAKPYTVRQVEEVSRALHYAACIWFILVPAPYLPRPILQDQT